MNDGFFDALRAGTERVAAWTDLLDNINVFPVADGDTGRNLLISLLPLKSNLHDRSGLIEKIFLSARGNSGNIAAHFFSEFLLSENTAQFPETVRAGSRRAWQSVSDPQTGTMLSVFDELGSALEHAVLDDRGTWVSGALTRLEGAVLETARTLPVLRSTQVVDSGALGMFIFFDAFLNALYLQGPRFMPATAAFRDKLAIHGQWTGALESGTCIDAVIKYGSNGKPALEGLSRLGGSLVAHDRNGCLKVHLHTKDQAAVMEELSRAGNVIQWAADDLEEQTRAFSRVRASQVIHIVTDAAGSVTRDDARRLNITLLDSYITIGTKDYPETHVNGSELYQAMRTGIKTTTSQASVSERSQHYEKVLGLYGTALYLCVGSVFTGNYGTVMDWKKQHDTGDRLTVIDTGSASGRLGLAALATADFAQTAPSAKDVIDFARHAAAACEEYIFLDTLRFLAAGGRMSKTGAVFGNMLHLKPVVSPLPEGAKKVAVVRSKNDQIAFALRKLREGLREHERHRIMLEYTDNKEWVERGISPRVKSSFPDAEIILQPLSLTTGVHTGPGTWAVAFLPANTENTFAK